MQCLLSISGEVWILAKNAPFLLSHLSGSGGRARRPVVGECQVKGERNHAAK